MYENKDVEYFSHARPEVADFLKKNNCLNQSCIVLDIGCGIGKFEKTLNLASESSIDYIGIDLKDNINAGYTHITLDLNSFDIDEIKLIFERYKPTLVILNDVLEHLIEPENLIAALSSLSKSYNFKLSISIPNLRFFPVLKNLIFEGNFDYTSSGVLDETHLRFFTKKSFEKILLKNNFKVLKFEMINVPQSRFLKMFNLILRNSSFFDTVAPQILFLIEHEHHT